MPLLPEENFEPQSLAGMTAPFESTREAAGKVAARFAKLRYVQILLHLRDIGPSCIFEIAAALKCHDHQISGRFSALRKDGLIYADGSTRATPSGCKADVYQISTVGLSVIGSSMPIQTPLEGSS